mmetsp:Transcript_106067/g.299884  ORF Transcript_106067/g.299884 Transcript_106067/m.299884 type:complete len:466 (+) Transcript_106067:1797-3194(+)
MRGAQHWLQPSCEHGAASGSVMWWAQATLHRCSLCRPAGCRPLFCRWWSIRAHLNSRHSRGLHLLQFMVQSNEAVEQLGTAPLKVMAAGHELRVLADHVVELQVPLLQPALVVLQLRLGLLELRAPAQDLLPECRPRLALMVRLGPQRAPRGHGREHERREPRAELQRVQRLAEARARGRQGHDDHGAALVLATEGVLQELRQLRVPVRDVWHPSLLRRDHVDQGAERAVDVLRLPAALADGLAALQPLAAGKVHETQLAGVLHLAGGHDAERQEERHYQVRARRPPVHCGGRGRALCLPQPERILEAQRDSPAGFGTDRPRDRAVQRGAAAGNRELQLRRLGGALARKEVAELLVVDLHDLGRDLEPHPALCERDGLALELLRRALGEVLDRVRLAAARGAVGKDADGLAVDGRDELVVNRREDVVVGRVHAEQVVEKECPRLEGAAACIVERGLGVGQHRRRF